MKSLYALLVSTTLLLAADPAPLEVNATNLVGTWESVDGEMNGVKAGKDFGKTVIRFDQQTITLNGGVAVKYFINDATTPASIDIHTNPMQVGILKFVDSELHLCFGKEDHRPVRFKSAEGDDCLYLVLKKLAPAARP